MNAHPSRPWLLLAIAVSAWSLSPLLIYNSRGLAPSPVLGLYAVSIGAAIASVATVVLPSIDIRTAFRSVRAEGRLWSAAGVGLGAFVAYPLLYFSAIQSAPPASVNLVNYLWPITGILVVAVFRASDRSLEIALAGAFGFAGAALAIIAGHGRFGGQFGTNIGPFALAACGALVYGGISAFMNLSQPGAGTRRVHFILVALGVGGVFSAAVLGILFAARVSAVAPHITGTRAAALLAYAVLLPCAHVGWLTAVQDPQIPAFATAFLVPVAATGVLAIAVDGQAGPEVLSALALVMCGIAFAAARHRGVPVGFAVGLAFLASIQVSQGLADTASGPIDAETGFLGQLIAAVIAIFAGFVLSNAIRRYATMQAACGRFYAHAALLQGDGDPADVRNELDVLDETVLVAPRETARPWTADPRFGLEWADIEVAVTNRVSAYEWLVLLLGGGGLLFALHVFAISSTSSATVILRAFGSSVIVGVLFAVRDYDRRRPKQLCEMLIRLRERYGFAVEPDSPLRQKLEPWLRPMGIWERIGLGLLVIVCVLAIGLNAAQ